MRAPLVLLVTTLLAVPVPAQRPVIAPARSVLFRAPTDLSLPDTTGQLHHPSVIKGAGIGAGAGLLVGVALGAYQASGRPCSCDDPGLEPIVGGLLGAVIGSVVGASLADERRQKERHRDELPSPVIARTENGTPLAGDSTRLVGRDPHGVRGGIAGALMGGVAGFAVPHLVYSLQHSGASTDGASAGGGGPSAIALGISTLTGVVSGYLIAALLSRH